MSAHHSLTAEQHLTPQSDAVPAPVTTTYVGRRRALGTAPEEPPWPMYIGKRRAVLDESTRQASHVASGQSGETAPSAASAFLLQLAARHRRRVGLTRTHRPHDLLGQR